MLGACRLNNRSIRVCRRDATYQAVMIDLALLGAISKEDCETLIGCGIPAGLTLPNGNSYMFSESDNDESDNDESDNDESDNDESDNDESDNDESDKE